MSDSPKTIKVVDRRMFTADGEVREEIRAEMDSVEEAAPSKPAPAPEAPPEEPLPGTNPAFLRLLDMLAQTASLYLEGIPDPATGRRHVELAGARQIIDSLLALREKTRGRLSFEETDAIDGLVGELQMVFTRMAVPGKSGMPVPPPPGAKKRG